MARTLKDLVEETLALRPDVAELMEQSKLRNRLAIALIGLRRERKVSQREIARRLGGHQPAVARVESGVGSKMQTTEAIVDYARALGLEVGLVFVSKDRGDRRIEAVVSLSREDGAQEFLDGLMPGGDGCSAGGSPITRSDTG